MRFFASIALFSIVYCTSISFSLMFRRLGEERWSSHVAGNRVVEEGRSELHDFAATGDHATRSVGYLVAIWGSAVKHDGLVGCDNEVVGRYGCPSGNAYRSIGKPFIFHLKNIDGLPMDNPMNPWHPRSGLFRVDRSPVGFNSANKSCIKFLISYLRGNLAS